MSAEARNDPEGYRQREGEHKPYEPVKATKPEATDGDRELAEKLVRVINVSLRAVIPNDLPNISFADNCANTFEKAIASHVAARLAPVEAERDALAKELEQVQNAAGFCEKHQPTGGTRRCLVCAIESLCAAIGEIALICEDPEGDYKVTGYDLHCDEKQVVEQVRALKKKKSDALRSQGNKL